MEVTEHDLQGPLTVGKDVRQFPHSTQWLLGIGDYFLVVSGK